MKKRFRKVNLVAKFKFYKMIVLYHLYFLFYFFINKVKLSNKTTQK